MPLAQKNLEAQLSGCPMSVPPLPLLSGVSALSGARESWLVADMGGSNARFAWSPGSGSGVEHIRKLAVSEHPHLVDAVHSYLQELARIQGPSFRPPSRAAFAVATAVRGDEVTFTNSPWAFSRQALQDALGLQDLIILNDFEALALSLPRLKASQLQAIGPLPVARGTLAVIGPGTGLGVAGVVQTPSGWVALPGEGGHATLAANDDFESALLSHVRQSFEHVSAERLLSGIGLPTLHQAVAAALSQASPTLDAPEILERGLSGADPLCLQTLDSFCALLGSFAGNVALTLGARDGVYIGGGIVPRLGEFFMRSKFRERFEGKGRLRSYLQATPTALITDTLAALEGAALALEQSGPRI
jgi:glucokinase